MDATQRRINEHAAIKKERENRLAPVSAKPISTLDKSQGTELWVKAQGECDYILPAFGINNNNGGEDLIIGTPEGAIYITKEIAMAFFNLVEQTTSKIWQDE